MALVSVVTLFGFFCLQLPDQLEAQEGLISGWSFPGECLQGDGRGDAILQMKGYTELLRTKVTALESIPCVCVCILCSKAFPNGACLEALLRIIGAAAFYFTHLFFKAMPLRFYEN